MKIVFIGSVEFSAEMLKELILMQANIVGVCTLAESKINADHFDLMKLTNNTGIPSRYASDVNDFEVTKWIKSLLPDVIFCFGWSKLIKKELLMVPQIGVVGFHPTALPANRGRHPLIWALALGLTETASTFFFMDEGADSGQILSQVPIQILPDDNATSLYEKAVATAKMQMREFVPLLTSGNYPRNPQTLSCANVWRKRGKEDGRIDWRMAAETIHNLVRSLAKPYVGAYFDFGELEVKVWRTQTVGFLPLNLEPGKVVDVSNGGPLIKTGIGGIRLIEIEPQIQFTEGQYL